MEALEKKHLTSTKGSSSEMHDDAMDWKRVDLHIPWLFNF